MFPLSWLLCQRPSQARATIATGTTANGAPFAQRAGAFEFGIGFLIDDTHQQAVLAALVDLKGLDLDGHAFRTTSLGPTLASSVIPRIPARAAVIWAPLERRMDVVCNR